MKKATVADLRNNFRRLSAWLENGESVEISKRGRRFARLVPLAEGPGEAPKISFEAQLRGIWGDRVFSAAEVEAMRTAEVGDRS